MEKQGWVSIWLGNIKEEDSIEKNVDLTYDEDGESVSLSHPNFLSILILIWMKQMRIL